MGSLPKLSVVTASFNSEKTIEATFQSVLSQTYRPLEYIVVDGGSEDSTVKIIQQYERLFAAQSISFQWISEKDSGIYNAWNKSLDLFTGDWISFLGSDDIYLDGAIDKYGWYIQQNPLIDFVTAKAKIVANGRVQRTFGEKWSWKVFKREMKILHAGGFLNKRYLSEFGKFDESFKIAGDYEYLLRKGPSLKVGFIDQFLVEMGAEGVSDKLISKALKEAKHARVKNHARTSLNANLDYYWVLFKIKLKQLLYVPK